jgi:predicted flap endonuclease-1-like 5' DNA nuclease
MFGALRILFDVLESFATKKSGSSSSTKSRPAEPRPSVEPLAKPAGPRVKATEKPAVKPDVKPAAKPDDLRRIEGIGRKVSSVLLKAGITTFSQLAATDVRQLKAILAAAGIGPSVNPSSWPEQASLAEAEDWEAFDKLKDELKAGRRS